MYCTNNTNPLPCLAWLSMHSGMEIPWGHVCVYIMESTGHWNEPLKVKIWSGGGGFVLFCCCGHVLPLLLLKVKHLILCSWCVEFLAGYILHHRKLHPRRHQTSRRHQHQWTCWDLLQQYLGYCVWWLLGYCWCSCCLQTAGICWSWNFRYCLKTSYMYWCQVHGMD